MHKVCSQHVCCHTFKHIHAHTHIHTHTHTHTHWHRLVKNIGSVNQNIGGQMVVKSDTCMGVTQLLGGHVPRLPPQV